MADTETAGHAIARRLRCAQWVGELILIAGMYVAYELLRGVHGNGRSFANDVGRTLLSWERAVHIDPEKWLSLHLDHITWLAVPACYLYATAHYVVTPAVLIWLYVRHRYSYGRGRSWLAFSTMCSLVVFYLLPTTPPRLLHQGFPDVMADMSSYGWWGTAGSAPRGLGGLTNQFAAMPSMHVGWSLWCGVMIYRCSPHRWVRALGLAYPVLTTAVVISTGNHYLLDAVGGVAMMAIGALVTQSAYRLGNRLKARRSRDPRAAGTQNAATTVSAPGAVAAATTIGATGRPGVDDGHDRERDRQNSLHTTSG